MINVVKTIHISVELLHSNGSEFWSGLHGAYTHIGVQSSDFVLDLRAFSCQLIGISIPLFILSSHRRCTHSHTPTVNADVKKGKASPYSITDHRVLKLIPVLGSQPAGDVSHKPGGRLPLLSARPTVTLATLKRAATKFAAW